MDTVPELHTTRTISAPLGTLPPPAALTVDAALGGGVVACSSSSESSHLGSMFHLSPEAEGLPAAGQGDQLEWPLQQSAAHASSGSEAEGDLVGFLADLKLRYGLADPFAGFPGPSHSNGSQPLSVSVNVTLQSPGRSSPPPLSMLPPPPSPLQQQNLGITDDETSRQLGTTASGDMQRGHLGTVSSPPPPWREAARPFAPPDGPLHSDKPSGRDIELWQQESSAQHQPGGDVRRFAEREEAQEALNCQPTPLPPEEQQQLTPGWQHGRESMVQQQPVVGSEQSTAEFDSSRQLHCGPVAAQGEQAEQAAHDQHHPSIPDSPLPAISGNAVLGTQPATRSPSGSGPGPGPSAASCATTAAGGPVPAACQQPPLRWQALHTSLVQRGFPGLFGDGEPASQPDPAATFQALHSLLQEHARCSVHQQRLLEATQAAGRRERALVSGFAAEARKRAAETAKWKQVALSCQVSARDAQRGCQQRQGATEQLAAEARQLDALVTRHQHALSVQAGEVERLKQALAAQREREERRQQADREAYERLKQAHAVSKAADTPSAAAAAMKAAAREMKPLDILRVFEAERAHLQEEAAVAAAEAHASQAQLARAQEMLHGAGLPCEHFDKIEGQALAASRRAAVAEDRAAQLAEEVAALRLELSERPTQAQMASLQRQADIMERQLAKAEKEQAAAQTQEAREANRQAALRGLKRKQLSTREMIQRDRNLERLGLYCAAELPKPVLVEVVQDACALLECRQPLELCAAIRPVQELAALVPRMERFVGDVCGAVFQRGQAHVPEALRQDNPADIPAVLTAWIAELSELVEMRGVMRALLRQLASRVAVQPGDSPPVSSEVVPLVASLVELERTVYHSREVLEAAETALAAQPDVLINRICLHFQRLFGCRSLEGVLPAMNKLWTFLCLLRTALGLDPGATLEACANRLEQVLSDSRGALATMLPAREPHQAASALPDSACAVVVEVAPRRRALQDAAQVAVERMAAKRRWPQVQIFVPARAGSGVDGAANCS
ncbi:hypothetical protein ACK3TF_001414 [Chlorella vulgaris]